MPPAGRGSVDVYTHKDGLRTFYLRLRVDGHRHRVRLGIDRDGWTAGRAQVALEEQLARVHARTWRRPESPPTGEQRDPTFRAFASSWLEDNTLEWRASTIRDITWRLSSHLLPQIGDDRLSSFDITKVTSVKTALLRERRRISEQIDAGVVERDAHNMPLRPLSHESINKCLALLARILDDAVERGYLADNPARRVRRLRHHRPRRPVLEVHEVAAMLDAADRLDSAAAGHSADVLATVRLRAQGLIYREIADRLSISVTTVHYRLTRHQQAGEPIPQFRTWVRVLCAAGLRIDEACRARRCDVDLIAGCLRVGHAKTPAGVRRVQLTPDTAADMDRYLRLTADRSQDSPLLPTARGTFNNRTNAGRWVIKPLVAETNVVLGERGQPALPEGVTAHALRKTYFTFLHEAGAPPRWVADQGGHSDPSTSLRIYTESLRERERGHHGEAFDAMLNAANTVPRRRGGRANDDQANLFDDDRLTADERP